MSAALIALALAAAAQESATPAPPPQATTASQQTGTSEATSSGLFKGFAARAPLPTVTVSPPPAIARLLTPVQLPAAFCAEGQQRCTRKFLKLTGAVTAGTTVKDLAKAGLFCAPNAILTPMPNGTSALLTEMKFDRTKADRIETFSIRLLVSQAKAAPAPTTEASAEQASERLFCTDTIDWWMAAYREQFIGIEAKGMLRNDEFARNIVGGGLVAGSHPLMLKGIMSRLSSDSFVDSMAKRLRGFVRVKSVPADIQPSTWLLGLDSIRLLNVLVRSVPSGARLLVGNDPTEESTDRVVTMNRDTLSKLRFRIGQALVPISACELGFNKTADLDAVVTCRAPSAAPQKAKAPFRATPKPPTQ